MKLQDVERLIKGLRECDDMLRSMGTPMDSMSESMRICLVGAIIERRNNLITRLKDEAHIEVDA